LAVDHRGLVSELKKPSPQRTQRGEKILCVLCGEFTGASPCKEWYELFHPLYYFGDEDRVSQPFGGFGIGRLEGALEEEGMAPGVAM
jgi:hypothetical protein